MKSIIVTWQTSQLPDFEEWFPVNVLDKVVQINILECLDANEGWAHRCLVASEAELQALGTSITKRQILAVSNGLQVVLADFVILQHSDKKVSIKQ